MPDPVRSVTPTAEACWLISALSECSATTLTIWPLATLPKLTSTPFQSRPFPPVATLITREWDK